MLGKRSQPDTSKNKVGSKINVDMELSDNVKDYSVVDDLSIFLQRIDKTCGNNKFFVIQALKHKKGTYHLFTRWGVMATTGQ